MKLIEPANGIGAEFTNFDARKITKTEAQLIKQKVYQHKLVIFREQKLSAVEYIEFARKLGRPQVYFQKNYHHPEHPEIFVSSNVPDEKGNKVGVAGTGRYWHTDYQFFSEPLPLVMVYPQVLPSSRGTFYIDMEQVYQRMPKELRTLVEGRRAIHEGKWRYKVTPDDIDRAIVDILAEVEKMVPPMTHPSVIEHPLTGRKALYVSSGFTTGLEGLSIEEGKHWLSKIFAFAEQQEHIHTHQYQYGDILLWENRTLIHKASSPPKSEPSMSFRIGIYDDLPFYANA